MSVRYQQPDNEHDFEKFCLKFLQRHWNNQHLDLYGKRGEEQSGVDIIDTKGSDPFKAGQCKHHEPHKTIPPKEIKDEVAKALKFDPPLDHFAILTTARASTQAQKTVIAINKEHKTNGRHMVVELFQWEKIEDLLDDYPDVADLLPHIANSHLKQIECSTSLISQQLGGISKDQYSLCEKMAELRTDLSTQVDSVISTSAHRQFDAEIDEAEVHLEKHDPQVARINLERIRRRHWDNLSDVQRYRIKAAFANIAISQGEDAEAAKFLLEAKSHQPNAERAQVNEAIAYDLLRKTQRAHELAEGLLGTYPHSGPLVSCWIRTAPREVTLDHLKTRVTDAVENDTQVNTALAIRALEFKLFEEAEAFARKAIAAKSDWVGPKSLLGQALINQVLYGHRANRWKVGEGQSALLEDAITVFTETLTLADRQKTTHHVADCFVFRGLAHSLLDNHEMARIDYTEAIRHLPQNAMVYFRFATYLLDQNQNEEAIVQLRKSLTIAPGAEAELCLAEVLKVRAQPGDSHEATDIFVRLAMTDDLSLRSSAPEPCVLFSLRSEAFNSAIDCFINDSRLPDAETFLEKVPAGRFSDVSISTAHSRLKLARDEFASATTFADEAIRSISDATPKPDLRSLALHLMRLERQKDALPIWQRLNISFERSGDVRHLVRCAQRVKQYGIVLRTCRAAREAGLEDRWLFEQELFVLEMFDVEGAVSLVQNRVAARPEDKTARMHLSRLGLILLRPELATPHLDMLMDLDEVTPYGGHIVVEILRRYGDPNAAVRYAYEMYRRNTEDHIANQTLVMSVMGHGTPPPVFADCSVVATGMAVRYSEVGAQDKWAIIEDSPSPNPANREFPESHPLAQSLNGKKVGETFLITKTSGRDRIGKIKEILPKYIYRMREICDNWQERFPDVSFIQIFRMAKDAASLDGGEQVDLTDMKLIAQGRYERLKEAERLHQSHQIPFYLFAKLLGCTTSQAFGFVALRPALIVHSNSGLPKEQEAGLEDLKNASHLVLDITAIASSFLVELGELLEKWRGKLVISQGTAAELRSMLQEALAPTKPTGNFGKVDEGYYYHVQTPEEAQVQAECMRSFIQLVLAKCEIRGCPEMADLDPEVREHLVESFGQDAVESMLIARAPGHVLWAEDGFVGYTSAWQFAVRRVWTQLVVEHASNTGVVSMDVFLTTSAKLLGFRYEATSLNPLIVSKAGELAEWDVRRWPFTQALAFIKNTNISAQNIVIFVSVTLKLIYRRILKKSDIHNILITILEHMLSRSDGLAAIRQLLSAVPIFFQVDVIAADEVTCVIHSWAAEASKRPRMVGSLIIPFPDGAQA